MVILSPTGEGEELWLLNWGKWKRPPEWAATAPPVAAVGLGDVSCV